jgi:hypothetical protein
MFSFLKVLSCHQKLFFKTCRNPPPPSRCHFREKYEKREEKKGKCKKKNKTGKMRKSKLNRLINTKWAKMKAKMVQEM